MQQESNQSDASYNLTDENVMTALCIWEAVLESIRDLKLDETPLEDWMKQREGVYSGRQAAMDLAPMLDEAWHYANCEGTFDWEYVPYMLWGLKKLYRRPVDITQAGVNSLALCWMRDQDNEI